MAESKTNAQRQLERMKIPYQGHGYDHGDGAIDGLSVAQKCGFAPERVFKTLVTRAASKGLYVFVIPVAAELDLKAAARAAGEKSVEMIAVKELLPLTGYIRGGCSPIGMKKRYPTFVDESALSQTAIVISAGKLGAQIELAPNDLAVVTGCSFAPLTHG